MCPPCNNLVIYDSIIEDPGKIAHIKPDDEACHVYRKQKNTVLHLFICVLVHMCHSTHGMLGVHMSRGTHVVLGMHMYHGTHVVLVHTCHSTHVWVGDQHAGLNSLLHHVNPEAQTRVFSLGNQCSLAEPSCQPAKQNTLDVIRNIFRR